MTPRNIPVTYAECGADMALLARRKDRLQMLAAEIEKMGRKALAVVCDVSVEQNVEEAVAEVMTHFGRIDILLNNAGIAVGGTVEQLSSADWDRSMNINVKGMLLDVQIRYSTYARTRFRKDRQYRVNQCFCSR